MYSYASGFCCTVKKIGDKCDDITETCYDGECQGVCTCGRRKQPSEDRKKCVGNSYGEHCDTEDNNFNWKISTCEYSKYHQVV